MLPAKRVKGQRYTAEQLGRLRYTLCKPDTPATKKQSLFGPRLVTYEQKQRHKRQLADDRRRRAASNMQQNNGQQNGQQNEQQDSTIQEDNQYSPAAIMRRRAKSGSISPRLYNYI